jgi:hypothetical protein
VKSTMAGLRAATQNRAPVQAITPKGQPALASLMSHV